MLFLVLPTGIPAPVLVSVRVSKVQHFETYEGTYITFWVLKRDFQMNFFLSVHLCMYNNNDVHRHGAEEKSLCRM